MKLRCTKVSVEPLDGGPRRLGVLCEGEDGRTILTLAAATEAELAEQLDESGGLAGYVRRHGALPLDPGGIAPGEDGGVEWVEPAG